ncbi:MAG: succinate dehydrogenase/fumarate reductase cytochrome b subunit [Proteobacteria bacterium]|nr:succinate dehydrogenase/fumarate reductase cytochrome b subunit [Pseudomonadota bacterium]MBU2518932.1 succinate dehydrogenase/fumarate reductase cytochrome b subunit [Pseudomonadota bacterium]
MSSSVDTAIFVKPPTMVSAYLDWLQMLTGAGLILFMWSHMVLVASVNLGANVMNTIAHFFEATYMAQVGGPIIAATMLVHFVLAARKIPYTSEAQGVIWRHARMLHHTDTWLWLIQALTAMVILIMGSVHIWTVLTNLPITAAKSAARVQGGFWGVFYLILLPMVELHVGIGFYRIAVKWGFIKRSGRKKFHRFENIWTGVFILIGLITIIRLWTLPI